MTKNLRTWFYSVNIFKNGIKHSYQSGSFCTNAIGSELHTLCVENIMDKEKMLFPEIQFKNVHLLALNCID